MDKSKLTFLIIAQNEESRIAGAIESCSDLGQVIVVDGGSTDATKQIASDLGAQVLSNPFQYAAQQYNYGLEHVTTPWAFILDSDERLGAEARSAIAELKPGDLTAFWIDRLNYFCGRPVRYSGWSPDLNVRLLRVDSARYDDRPVHARVEVHGQTGRLAGRIHHLSYVSISQYVSKLNRFTSREVEARAEPQRVLDARSRMRRIYLRMPFKGSIRFAYMYFMRRGFLDGRVGLDLAYLSSFYERVVTLKARYESDERARLEPSDLR